jgi:hypothetical protein
LSNNISTSFATFSLLQGFFFLKSLSITMVIHLTTYHISELQ